MGCACRSRECVDVYVHNVGLYTADGCIVQRTTQKICNGSSAAEADCPYLQVAFYLMALNIVAQTAQNAVGGSLEAVMIAAELFLAVVHVEVACPFSAVAAAANGNGDQRVSAAVFVGDILHCKGIGDLVRCIIKRNVVVNILKRAEIQLIKKFTDIFGSAECRGVAITAPCGVCIC